MLAQFTKNFLDLLQQGCLCYAVQFFIVSEDRFCFSHEIPLKITQNYSVSFYILKLILATQLIYHQQILFLLDDLSSFLKYFLMLQLVLGSFYFFFPC